MSQAQISNLRGAAGASRTRLRFRSYGASLGLAATTPAELIRKLEHGFSFHTLQNLSSHSGLTVARLASLLGIPERTLARRKTSGKLTLDESERLLRLSAIFEKAVELFEGDVAAAVNWLTSPRKALNDHAPLEYSRTELGAREVESLIGRLEHGVFA
ncbi:MAG: DUF2384 domain-containing protein [Acidobacteriia bacterium]|nr:DUF2384 domain-containing protein [Terriglobia bacterium]